ncbi:unnamed protein product [Bathycoccus prasinos]
MIGVFETFLPCQTRGCSSSSSRSSTRGIVARRSAFLPSSKSLISSKQEGKNRRRCDCIARAMLRNNNDNGNRKSDEKEDDGIENTTATRLRRLRRVQTPKKLFSFLLSSSSHSSSKKKKNSKLNPTMDEALRRRLSLVAEYANEMMDDVFNNNNNNNNNAKKKLFFEYKLGTTEEQRQERIERQLGSSYEEEEEEEETSGNSGTNTTSKGNDERIENNSLLSVTLGVDSTIDEPTTIEDILFPQEELRREVDALEKDPDDFDFEGEEDFVASLSKNELFRNVSAETRGFLLFNLIIFMMGSNIVLVKMAQTNISPDAFGLFRFLAASLTFLPFSKYALRDSRILKMGIELGFWCAVGYYFQAVGLDITDASSASFISSFTVISVPLIAMWAGRKVPKSTWAAIAVAIFGLALIEGVVPIPGLEAHDTKEALSIVSDAVSDVVSTSVLTGEVVQSNPFEVLDSALSLPLESVTDIAEVATVETVQSLYGDFAILISAVVFAVQVFRTDVLANEEHLGTKEMMGMCSIQLFVVTLFFGGTLLNDVPRDDGHLSTLFTNSLAELSAFDWHSVPWFLVAYTGVVTTAFALYAETVALKYIPSEKASVIYTTEPLWGAAFAYVLLGERMGINGYIGGALILASSFLSSSSNKAIVLPGEEEEASAMKKIE